MVMEKLVFVHLSDIHFTGLSGTTVHDLDSDIRNELLRDASKLTKELGGATGVLVTGDIAFSGQHTEYERAAIWLLEFCRAIRCPDENVWVVPGNHDVDRKLAGALITKMLHERLRSTDEAELDIQLRKLCLDSQSASALFAPLAEYNAFAARFQCSISAEKPFWERDLILSCGTIIRLRGLCSALVSDEHDQKGNIVLGTLQASVPRTDGVLYVTLCHHPPDWLRDQDSVVTHLESKVHIQLFGHKHSQRVQIINEKLRIIAGAMHPERKERDWIPTYNIVELTCHDDERVGARLFQRRWHQSETCFVPEHDPKTGNPHRESIWEGFPRTTPKEARDAAAPDVTRSDEIGDSAVVAPTAPRDSEAMPSPEHKRRLTYRFLTLPFRHQIAIAQSLDVLTDQDRALNDEALFIELFKRAADNGLLAKLWDETEKRHTDPATFNPFEGTK
jgi:predicted phosphodiesterase